MAVPRGFALVLGDLNRHGWDWRALSHRGPWAENKIIDHKTVTTERTAVKTVLVATLRRPDEDGALHLVRGLFALWIDGKFGTGWTRCPAHDPTAVAIGARDLRPLAADPDAGPHWARPDLGEDEG